MKSVLLCIAILATAVTVNAADNEATKSVTEDYSKNPITGTQKTTKKWHKKKKDATGSSETDVKETTKKMTDGSTEKTTNVEKTEKNN